jgi:hypothetical protein
MAQTQRSLKHEYTLYLEREIEDYKDSIPRAKLMAIGDEAVAALEKQEQIAITEMVLWEEVDRIISRRLGLKTYNSWRTRCTRLRKQYRSLEHWGLRADDFVVRSVQPAIVSAGGHVLVAGDLEVGSALYLAAHGRAVTAIDQQADAIGRVMAAASDAGLTERVRGCVADLKQWTPDVPLSAVICSAHALDHLSRPERERAIEQLQQATLAGGMHVVRTIAGDRLSLSVEELRTRYRGWVILEETTDAGVSAMLAQKEVA